MKPKVTHFNTADGSSTLLSDKYGAHYHSQHGAITESKHVFIKAGLNAVNIPNINLLEVGFGTGLNAALTAQTALEKGIKINYVALELHPLTQDDYRMLNYSITLESTTADLWEKICQSPWNKANPITDLFSIEKINVDFTTWRPANQYHLVYFDAFAPNDQPEMWEKLQFQKIYNALAEGGVLVTYCVKGIVKNTLREVGFDIERLQGPPGKKHMLRAWKRNK